MFLVLNDSDDDNIVRRVYSEWTVFGVFDELRFIFLFFCVFH